MSGISFLLEEFFPFLITSFLIYRIHISFSLFIWKLYLNFFASYDEYHTSHSISLNFVDNFQFGGKEGSIQLTFYKIHSTGITTQRQKQNRQSINE